MSDSTKPTVTTIPSMPTFLSDPPIKDGKRSRGSVAMQHQRGPRKPPVIREKKNKSKNNTVMDGSFTSICQMLGGKRIGAETIINLVRQIATTNMDAAAFITLYDSKSKDFHRCISAENIELLCIEASLPWPRLVTWAYEVALTTGQQLAAMTAAMHLPDVVNKTVKFAKQKDGHRDRDMLFRSTGFIPTAGGISIVNNVAARAQAANVTGEAFVPFEQDVIDIEDGRRSERAEPALVQPQGNE